MTPSIIRIPRLSMIPQLAGRVGDSEYIPITGLSTISNISRTDMYHIGHVADLNYIHQTNKIALFCDTLYGHNNNWAMKMVRGDYEDKNYYVTANMIYRYLPHMYEIVPLMMTCVKTAEFHNVDWSNPDVRQFTILVDLKFIIEHNDLYRNIKRSYLNIVSGEIDVLYTSRMLDLTFASKIELPQFTRLDGMMLHLQEEMNTIVQEEILDRTIV